MSLSPPPPTASPPAAAPTPAPLIAPLGAQVTPEPGAPDAAPTPGPGVPSPEEAAKLPPGAPGSVGGGSGPPLDGEGGAPGGGGDGLDHRVPTLADGGAPLDPTLSLAPGGEVSVNAAPLGPASGASDVSDSVSPSLLMGLGGVLLVGALLYWVFGRGGGGGGRAPDRRALERLRPAAEPGLIHPELPSLSDGLSVWVVPVELQGDVIHAILAEMAVGRQVLVAAPSRVVLPLVHGGPVYRVEGGRPQQLKRAGAGLSAQERCAALIVGPEGAEPGLEAWAEALPEGVGGVVILSERPVGWAAPIIELRAAGEGLELLRGDRRWSARTVGGRLVIGPVAA